MIAPPLIRLRVRNAVARARLSVAQIENEAVLRRRSKLAGVRALQACKKAFDLREQLLLPLMDERAQRQWRAWRKLTESQLRIIAGLE